MRTLTILAMLSRPWAFARRARLRRLVRRGPIPEHVAIVMDGNRRWARRAGFLDTRMGHRVGANHVHEVLRWCEQLEIRTVTLFICSTENLQRRDSDEISFLMKMIEEVIAEGLTREPVKWELHIAGLLDVLPATTAEALINAATRTKGQGSGARLNLAVGYGGRQEVVHAARALVTLSASRHSSLDQLAAAITPDELARNLYTAGQPDPDLIIRTSGEIRLSNFFVWQAQRAELYFCDALWPAFSEIDLLKAVRRLGLARRRLNR